MIRFLLGLFVMPVFLVAVSPISYAQSQKNATYNAILKPNRLYEIEIVRSYSGNNGFQDMVPVRTRQHVEITTGALVNGVVPVELVAFASRNEADLAATSGPGTVNWKLTMQIHPDGKVTDIRALEGEKGVDQVHAEGVALHFLGNILLASSIKAEGLADVRFRDPRKKKGKPGIIELSYSIPEMQEEKATPGEEKALAVTRVGSAQFNTDEQFFTEFSLEENSKIYATSDGTDEVTKEISSVQRTKVQTRITVK